MVIVDKTPYRSESGEISPIGLVQGMLKYGLSWQSRLKAQDAVIAIIGFRNRVDPPYFGQQRFRQLLGFLPRSVMPIP